PSRAPTPWPRGPSSRRSSRARGAGRRRPRRRGRSAARSCGSWAWGATRAPRAGAVRPDRPRSRLAGPFRRGGDGSRAGRESAPGGPVHRVRVVVRVGVLVRGVAVRVVTAAAARGLRPVLEAVDLREHVLGEGPRRPVEHDLAGAEAHDPAHELLGERHVVDVDDRRQLVLLGQLDEQPHDLTRRLGVEAGRGLVDEQDVGVLQEGAGDADALALPAGELVGALVELVGDPDALEELVGAVDGARREAPEPTAPEAYVAELAGEDVLHHGQAVDERELLEDHPDAAPFEPQPPAG